MIYTLVGGKEQKKYAVREGRTLLCRGAGEKGKPGNGGGMSREKGG